jgi:YfiH family protein
MNYMSGNKNIIQSVVFGTTDRAYDFRDDNCFASIERLAVELGGESYQIKLLSQIHSNSVILLDSVDQVTLDVEADALITQLKDIVIGIKTADCVPVIMFDSVTQTVAAVHVGRKGAATMIVEKTIQRMVNDCGVQPHNIECYLGPAIQQQNHYVFRDDVSGFSSEYFDPLPVGQHVFENPHFKIATEKKGFTDEVLKTKQSVRLDLPGVVIHQLISAGVNEEHITNSGLDTFTDDQYHSYRRDYPNHGLMATWVRL